MNLQFTMPARMFVGEGAVAAHEGDLAALGSRCLIVTGGRSAKLSGALSDVTAALDRAKVPWQVYDGIGQNPLLSACYRGGGAAREFGADFLIGIGGGSPLDATKAVAIFAANPGLDPEKIYEGWAGRALPFALVGTTAGTGSEVTKIAVLTSDATGEKKAIGAPDTYAALSMGDPKKYTASLSRDFTVSTALDAMAHAVESYFCKLADPFSRGFSLEAMRLLLPNLERLAESQDLPDPKGREELYTASILAGMAINQTGTAFCHAMGYILSERYGVPHGVACAVFLEEYLFLAEEEETEDFDDFCDWLGTSQDELGALIEDLLDIVLPVLSDREIEDLLVRWEGLGNMTRSPGNFDKDRQREVARRVLQGGRED